MISERTILDSSYNPYSIYFRMVVHVCLWTCGVLPRECSRCGFLSQPEVLSVACLSLLQKTANTCNIAAPPGRMAPLTA